LRGAANDVRLEIIDEGPGIPAAERERIWRPYQRGTTGQQTAGSGIGLSVVHDVVAQHGGRAWVEDAPSGHGARIVVTLPALQDDAPSRDASGEHTTDAAASTQASPAPAALGG
jgi:signal transduction histidine kinase